MEAGKTEELQRALSDGTYREQLYRAYFSKDEQIPNQLLENKNMHKVKIHTESLCVYFHLFIVLTCSYTDSAIHILTAC